jgi:hypothetical protein
MHRGGLGEITKTMKRGETTRKENKYKEDKAKYCGRNINKQNNIMLLLYLRMNKTEL